MKPCESRNERHIHFTIAVRHNAVYLARRNRDALGQDKVKSLLLYEIGGSMTTLGDCCLSACPPPPPPPPRSPAGGEP